MSMCPLATSRRACLIARMSSVVQASSIALTSLLSSPPYLASSASSGSSDSSAEYTDSAFGAIDGAERDENASRSRLLNRCACHSPLLSCCLLSMRRACVCTCCLKRYLPGSCNTSTSAAAIPSWSSVADACLYRSSTGAHRSVHAV